MNELDKYLDPTKFTTGEKVYHAKEGKFYEFTGSTWNPLTDYRGDPGLNSTASFYGASGGLQSPNFGTPGNNLFSSAFTKFRPTTTAETAKATSNYGMGADIDQSQYTGETGGWTQGGVQLWKLKDGTMTSKAPTGQTSQNKPVGASGIMEQGWVSPTTGQVTAAGVGLPSPLQGVQIENEADLQSKRVELARAGIPQSEWSKYISSPDAQGRLFWMQPATLTSPTGQKKIVAAGSTEASNLLNTGWTLGNKIGGGTEQINTSTLKPQENINLGGGQTDNTSDADIMAASAKSTIDDFYKLQNREKTSDQLLLDKLMEEIAKGVQGEGEMQLAEEAKRGIEAKNQALASANSQLKAKLAEIDALTKSYELANQTEEGKPQTLSRLQGAQAQNYKMYLAQKNSLASEAGILQANILGLQGEITAAQNAADRAVDLAFKDKTAKYNALIAQANILSQQVEADDKKYADAVSLYLTQQANALAEEKATKKMQVATVLDLMTKYPDSNISINDSVDTASAKVKNSAVYREQVRAGGGRGISNDWDKADQFIADNPTATNDEITKNLKQYTKLSDSDIASIVATRTQITPETISAPKQSWWDKLTNWIQSF